MTLGEKIKYLRQLKGLSQSELAKILCVTRQSVTNYERDANRPSFDLILKLSQEFNVPVDWLTDDNADLENLNNTKAKHKKNKLFKILIPTISAVIVAILTTVIICLIINVNKDNDLKSKDYSYCGYYLYYENDTGDQMYNKSIEEIEASDLPYHLYFNETETSRYINSYGPSCYPYSLESGRINVVKVYYNYYLKSYQHSSELIDNSGHGFYYGDFYYAYSILEVNGKKDIIVQSTPFTSATLHFMNSSNSYDQKISLVDNNVYYGKTLYMSLDELTGFYFRDVYSNTMVVIDISTELRGIQIPWIYVDDKYYCVLYLSNGDYHNQYNCYILA